MITATNAFLLALMVIAPVAAHAQSKNLGSYVGTIDVSGTQHGPDVTYRARVKVSMPVSDRDASSINAEFLSGEAPSASILVTQLSRCWAARLVNLLTEQHSEADSKGRNDVLLEPFGYRWYRVRGLDYLLKRRDIDEQSRT
jgi:hypothetical protein